MENLTSDMSKKTYIEPDIKIVKLERQAPLLDVSFPDRIPVVRE